MCMGIDVACLKLRETVHINTVGIVHELFLLSEGPEPGVSVH